jgi:uncharacterized membrane protein YkoI
MDRVKGIAAALAAVAALGVGGAAIASAAGGGDSSSPAAESAEDAKEGPDQAIGGSDLDKASAAALQHTGGGQVTDTEVGDEESYYEVEVSLDDGSQVDVQLDRGFNVVGDEADGVAGAPTTVGLHRPPRGRGPVVVPAGLLPDLDHRDEPLDLGACERWPIGPTSCSASSPAPKATPETRAALRRPAARRR